MKTFIYFNNVKYITMSNIKQCVVCDVNLKREDSRSDYHYNIKKVCSQECQLIYSEFKRAHPNYNNINKPFLNGMVFECRIKRKLENKGFYIVRSHMSKGIFDLIGFKKNKVYGFDLTRSRESKVDIKTDHLKLFMKENPDINVCSVYLDLKTKEIKVSKIIKKVADNNKDG